jgi:hypothetical protein
MAVRRAVLLLAAGVVVLLAAAATAGIRLAARKAEPAWQPPPASGPVPPPPLGGSSPEAAAAQPRILRVDSTGCAPVEEQGFTAAMTLDSVARSGGIPVEMLIRGLGLPAGVSRTTSLGVLMREHHFSLAEVRRVVEDYLKHCE